MVGRPCASWTMVAVRVEASSCQGPHHPRIGVLVHCGCILAAFSSFRSEYESPFLQRVSAPRAHRVWSQPVLLYRSNIDRGSHRISGSITFVVRVHDYGRLLGTLVQRIHNRRNLMVNRTRLLACESDRESSEEVCVDHLGGWPRSWVDSRRVVASRYRFHGDQRRWRTGLQRLCGDPARDQRKGAVQRRSGHGCRVASLGWSG